jgi:PilZ domain-containing protein
VLDKERRASIRFKPKSGSYIAYPEGTGAVKDLSLNGMFVLDPEPLPNGTKISFSLRHGTDEIRLQGIVTRSEPGQGMVIQFTELTREAIRRLKIYMAQLGPATGEPKKR